jgi:hypothetical protein
MDNAKEKPENLNRHINGGYLSPNIAQLLFNYIPGLKASLNKKVFLYQHLNRGFSFLKFKSQYPPIFRSLQKTDVNPDNTGVKLKDSFSLCPEFNVWAFNKLFKTSNQRWSFSRLAFTQKIVRRFTEPDSAISGYQIIY